MAGLGTYLWKNNNPEMPGYGEEFLIDVDALDQTSKPSNVGLPNLHCVPAGQPEEGRVFRTQVPNFYLDPETGQLFHSNFYGPNKQGRHMGKDYVIEDKP